MKVILIILAAVALVGIAIVGGSVLGERSTLSKKLAATEAELRDAKAELAKLKAERERAAAAARSTPAPAARPGVATPGATSPREAGTTEISGAPAAIAATQDSKALSKMLQSPQMKELMKQQQTLAVDMQYGPLFDLLGLSPEEKENFRQLLAARTMGPAQLGLELMNPELTPERKKAITQQMEQMRKNSDASIQQFLNNDEDWKTFRNWEDTQPERSQLQMAGAAAFSSAPLSQEQEQSLISLMHEARSLVNKAATANDAVARYDVMSEEGIQRQMQRIDESNRYVLERAPQFLNQAQMEALAKMQEQWRIMSETGMKMSSAMFGGKKN